MQSKSAESEDLGAAVPLASERPFVAISKFVVANGMSEEVRQAFVERPHLVDAAPGYVRMEVLRPLDNPDEFWLITHWTDQASYHTWHRGHTYHESHRGIPKGLKLAPQSTKISLFEVIAE